MYVSLGVMCSCVWWGCMWAVYMLHWRAGNCVLPCECTSGV